MPEQNHAPKARCRAVARLGHGLLFALILFGILLSKSSLEIGIGSA
jgi:hypothetical protein